MKEIDLDITYREHTIDIVVKYELAKDEAERFWVSVYGAFDGTEKNIWAKLDRETKNNLIERILTHEHLKRIQIQ